jgi:hypothetical protein
MFASSINIYQTFCLTFLSSVLLHIGNSFGLNFNCNNFGGIVQQGRTILLVLAMLQFYLYKILEFIIILLMPFVFSIRFNT